MLSSVLLLSLFFSSGNLQFTMRPNPVTPSAVVSGVVTDRTGHPLAGAEVRLINSTTGEVVSALSDENGLYRVAAADPAADYTVAVRRLGFTPEQRPGMRVGTSEGGAISFALDSLKVKFPTSRAAVEQKTK